MITHKELVRFINLLKEDFKMVGPVLDGGSGKVFVKDINNIEDLDWSGNVPFYSFKKFFLPPDEDLFKYNNKQNITSVNKKDASLVIFGLNILDLRALGMFDLIFKKDPYYQGRKLDILRMGVSGAKLDRSDYKIFTENFEENILEHLPFDIFFERHNKNGYQIFTGSMLGQKILNDAKILDFEHVEYAGMIREEGKDKQMLDLYSKVKNSFNNPIWKELGQRCYACGKCSMVCPTCYCFDFVDNPDLEGGKKIRQWGSCFYPEFSQVAGNNKFLDTIQKRIYYWYVHKFVSIPEKYSVPGCVSCMRCAKVCPAGINIMKVLNSL